MRRGLSSASSEDDSCVEASDGEDHDCLVQDLNVHEDQEEENPPDDLVRRIKDHRYLNGILELKCILRDGTTTWMDLSAVKSTTPLVLAHYVLEANLGKVSNGIHRRWARAFLRSLRNAERRQRRTKVNGFTSASFLTASSLLGTGLHKRRRVTKTAEPKQHTTRAKRTFKYGLEVPRTWKDVMRLDGESGTTRWQDAINKEVDALIEQDCFDFKTPNFKPATDYQFCMLHFVYDIKQDLRYKARLVCNGKLVDAGDLSTRATVVKTVSVRLLDIIAASQDLKVLTGDIGNAFVQATTNEKVYTRLGKELAAGLVPSP